MLEASRKEGGDSVLLPAEKAAIIAAAAGIGGTKDRPPSAVEVFLLDDGELDICRAWTALQKKGAGTVRHEGGGRFR